MRPVQSHAVTQGSAEEPVDRHVQCAGSNVPERQLDAGDSLVRHTAEVLARRPQHVPVQPLDITRILPYQQALEIAHAARDAKGVARVAALAPTHEPAVSLDFNENPRSPASVADKRLHSGDTHALVVVLRPGRIITREMRAGGPRRSPRRWPRLSAAHRDWGCCGSAWPRPARGRCR